MEETRIIVAGGRDFDDYEYLVKSIDEILSGVIGPIKFVSGTARGADTLGERYAKEHGIDVARFPADWDRYGKKAGYLRNIEMADYACEEGSKAILIAFWDRKSKGTEHMINIAHDHFMDVYIRTY